MKQQYDSYKPSGIDWIGNIPSHWKIAPLKRNLRMPLKYGANEPAESENKNYPRYIRITDIDNNGNLKDETFKSLEPAKATEYLLEKGDVLFARSGATVGKTYIFNEPYEACFAGYLIKASCSSGLAPQFLFYYTNSGMYNNWKNSIFIQSTIQNIGADKYSLLPLPLPPLAEQEAIAAWLDEKCEEIDAAIAKVDREIELIDELKQSEISRVVTRGLNPDAPLRPSGIDWIGDIPEHWAMARIRNIIEQTKNGIKIGPFGSALTGHVLTGLPYKVYGQWNIVGKDFMAGIGTVSASIFKNLQAYEVKENDILISMMGTIGKCSIVPSHICPGIMDSHVVKIRLDYNLYNSRYFEYIYDKDNSNIIISELNLKKKGSIMDGLNSSIIKDLHIPLPPLSEQEAIADYLDKKCAEIDGLKAKLTKKRETLTELRQSIISEVVTGKRKVI